MIKASIPGGYDEPQHTQATDYYASLEQRFQTQRALGVPRSKNAWDAEHTRLGSWNSGVGRPTQATPGYQSGVGQKYFDYNSSKDQP